MLVTVKILESPGHIISSSLFASVSQVIYCAFVKLGLG